MPPTYFFCKGTHIVLFFALVFFASASMIFANAIIKYVDLKETKEQQSVLIDEKELDFTYAFSNDGLPSAGVEAEYGDEFITLSCCAYHVEDGRFVVVGRRIK